MEQFFTVDGLPDDSAGLPIPAMLPLILVRKVPQKLPEGLEASLQRAQLPFEEEPAAKFPENSPMSHRLFRDASFTVFGA